MEQNDAMRAIILYQDKVALLKAVYPAFIGLLLSLPLFVFALRNRQRARLIVWVVSVLLFFWELFYFSTWYRLLFPRPVLVVDDEGITYQPSLPWFINSDMTIRWEEIATIYPTEFMTHGRQRTTHVRFLSIKPRDQESFFRRQRLLSPRRLPLLVEMSKTGTFFMLPERMISPLKVDILLTQIIEDYQAEIESHDIQVLTEHKTFVG
jgi:hypothetical protein